MIRSPQRRRFASQAAALGLVAAMPAWLATAQAQSVDEIKKKGELTVGLLVDFPPYGTVNSANDVTFSSTVQTTGHVTQTAGTGTTTFDGTSGAGIGGSLSVTTNAVTLKPGSTLTFDNTNTFQGVTAGNNTNRWGDTTAIALNGATLQLLGQNNAAGSSETVGAVSFDKGSTVVIKRNTAGNTVCRPWAICPWSCVI